MSPSVVVTKATQLSHNLWPWPVITVKQHFTFWLFNQLDAVAIMLVPRHVCSCSSSEEQAVQPAAMLGMPMSTLHCNNANISKLPNNKLPVQDGRNNSTRDIEPIRMRSSRINMLLYSVAFWWSW